MKKILIVLIVFFGISTSFSQTEEKQNTSNSSMLQLSKLSVTVGGDFLVTGSFPAFVSERVDELITQLHNQVLSRGIGSITDPIVVQQIEKKLNQFSLRNITLKHADGTEQKIDLLKFRLTGDFKDNPYLKNDDVIIFPPYNIKQNFFSVAGAVNSPGSFTFMKGDNLSDALLFARGINKSYDDVNGIVINRIIEDGRAIESDTVGISDNIPLKQGDRIVVLGKESGREARSVLVAGEVNSPGYIPITNDGTTLSEAIKSAGGFKESASLRRARIYTGNSVQLLLEREYGITLKDHPYVLDTKLNDALLKLEDAMMLRMSNITEVDSAYFYLENRMRVLNDGSSVDFSKLDDTSSAASKYIVHDGDIIIIPQKENSVYVYGQVSDPGHVPYVSGKDYKYYIEKAGGLGQYADTPIMVIKARSRHWIEAEKQGVKVENGDYIWVPRTQVHTFNYYVGLAGHYLSIVASVATIYLLLKSL